jgi:predicted ATPase
MKPRRTYDEIVDTFEPEGDHIPFVLSEVLEDATKREMLERFGKEAGLFKSVKVNTLGHNPNGPRQVMVTNEGRPANLIDVGYGVSQALPVVVQSILATKGSMLLLQQPEVHLHPRAQAALGSLFVSLVASKAKEFVVETHSDYIIDRVRQEVAKGAIAADQVGILYFEKTGHETIIYALDLDAKGNILDAPPTYREFFLQEELNLFTR